MMHDTAMTEKVTILTFPVFMALSFYDLLSVRTYAYHLHLAFAKLFKTCDIAPADLGERIIIAYIGNIAGEAGEFLIYGSAALKAFEEEQKAAKAAPAPKADAKPEAKPKAEAKNAK